MSWKFHYTQGLVVLALLVSLYIDQAAGIKCYTNNDNNWTALPSNNLTLIECGPLEQCGAFKFQVSLKFLFFYKH